MTITLLRKLLTYAMMGIAFLSVQLSDEISPIVTAGFWLGMLVSWFWEAPRIDLARWAKPWTGLTLATFAFTVIDIAVLKEFFLISAMNFVLFLATAKLFQRAEDKDYTQMMALSLMVLSAGAVLNDNLSYGVMFGLYVVTSTLALTTQHVVIENATYHSARNVRMERAILYSTLALGLLVFAGSTVFFFTFPRIGIGAFMSQSRRGVTMSGFGDNVELGRHGTIREDATVIMRVVFPEGPPAPIPEIHWRGLSLDFYDGRSWRDTDNDERQVTQFADGQGFGIMSPRSSMEWEELIRGTHVTEINLEPLPETDILFAPGFMRAISLPNTIGELPSSAFGRALWADFSGEVQLRTRGTLGKRYIAYSQTNEPVGSELAGVDWFDRYADLGEAVRAAYVEVEAQAGNTVEPAAELTQDVIERAMLAPFFQESRRIRAGTAQRYLQLPDDVVTPRMEALAESLREADRSQYAYTAAVEQWLRSELQYTTTLPEPAPGENLVDSFLFEWERGHCEYFATAMVILLRAQGVPARIVNGFLGGDYNEIGRYYAVRQANAHTWVEVYFPGHGWMLFDPTPAGAAEAGPEGMMRNVWLFLDSMRLAWFRWVVEYDIEKQFSLFRDATQRLSGNSELDDEEFNVEAAQWLRRITMWFWRNFEVLFGLFWVHLAGTLFFRGRNLRRVPWGQTDVVAAVAWVGAGGALVAMWWSTDDVAAGYALAAGPALLVVGFSYLVRGREDRDDGRRARRATQHAVSALYLRLLRALEGEGVAIGLSTTADELPSRLGLQDADTAARLAAFLRFYEAARFSGLPVDAATLRHYQGGMGALLRAIRQELRSRARGR